MSLTNNKYLICPFKSCKKFYENPISLPCGSTLCKEHFIKKHPLKKTDEPIYQIDCPNCRIKHEIPKKYLAFNTNLSNLIESNIHLNKNQKKMKKKLSEFESIFKLLSLTAQQNDPDVLYRNIRRQVESHRDEFVKQINTKSNEILKLIDELEKDFQKEAKPQEAKQLVGKKNKCSKKVQLEISEFIDCIRTPSCSNKQLVELLSKLNANIEQIKQSLKEYEKESRAKSCQLVFVQYFNASFGSLKVINGWEKKHLTQDITGELIVSKNHDFVILSNTEGSVYEGEYVQNCKHGHGSYYYSNGDVYTGQFINNEITGFGVQYYHAQNENYVGEFLEGKKHGPGVYYFENGDKFVGDWIANKATGRGIFYHANGEQFKAEFLDDIKRGEKKLFLTDGTMQTCWINDDLIS
jgi:hypothetical protein